MNISTDIWVWIAAFLTLCIFSFLYRDNPFYRFAEHVFVGVSNGYFISISFHQIMRPIIIEPLHAAFREVAKGNLSLQLFNPLYENNLIIVIWVGIGLLFFAQFSKKSSWLVRIPLAFTLGYSLGMNIPATFEATILKQIEGTILTRADFATFYGGSSSVLILVGVMATLTYFFFSTERKGALKHISAFGTVVIMIGFGASFGYTVMGRVSLAIGRFNFLFIDWLGIIQ